MTHLLSNIFLGCFLVGLILTLISLLFGFDHSHDGVHWGGDHGADLGGDAGTAGHAAGHGAGADGASFFSYQGMLMFLTWFGGIGYILNRHASGMVLVVVLGALAGGFAGALAVFYYLNKFIRLGTKRMRKSDYYLPGTLARVTSAVRLGEAGEITYVQGGTRKTCAARSDEGRAHPQGEEVVVVRYEKGIAYVRSATEALGGLAPAQGRGGEPGTVQ
ncbi:MAG: hypothetical protein N2111_12010 [Candidatus Sumerlaeaceae bacterium]|nr:hypothetical protein [Candidatus Sumerlaeaceae bacterium]